MHWFEWLMFVLYVFETTTYICQVGKEREPITPGLAAGAFVFNTLLLCGLIHYWGK